MGLRGGEADRGEVTKQRGWSRGGKGAGDRATLSERMLLQSDLEATGDCSSQGNG